ncbi:hypothetical protein L1286_04505 [Pseudoalteromonas sp. SMS1]|uniref:hypothetical protein n=1 Tax=Pseudoalteromonas sp. SMS1 TaxID=2908894 RepID=UPI001F2567A0|nr:hypothetical protein [Pseudoalteromonas sp. SMS1]MCF2856718.1 hypothetical protein [Pseudoalteromonas sp. SMS1]
MKSWLKYFYPQPSKCASLTPISAIAAKQVGQSKEALIKAILRDSLADPFITVRYHLGRRATDPLTDVFESVALVNMDKFLTSNRWEIRAEAQWQQGVYTLVFGSNKLLDVLNTRSIFYADAAQGETLSYLRLKSQSDLYRPVYRHIIPHMLKSYQRQFTNQQSSEQTFLEVKLLKELIASYCQTMHNADQHSQWHTQTRAAVEAHFIACIAANHVGDYNDEQVAKACEILQVFES